MDRSRAFPTAAASGVGAAPGAHPARRCRGPRPAGTVCRGADRWPVDRRLFRSGQPEPRRTSCDSDGTSRAACRPSHRATSSVLPAAPPPGQRRPWPAPNPDCGRDRPVVDSPPHRSQRAGLPHWAPAPRRRRTRWGRGAVGGRGYTRGRVRGVRTSGTPPRPRRPGARLDTPLGTGLRTTPTSPRAQIGEQPRHARQPPGDRAGGQTGLPVFQPDHPLPMPRRPLRLEEGEHIRCVTCAGSLPTTVKNTFRS